MTFTNKAMREMNHCEELSRNISFVLHLQELIRAAMERVSRRSFKYAIPKEGEPRDVEVGWFHRIYGLSLGIKAYFLLIWIVPSG